LEGLKEAGSWRCDKEEVTLLSHGFGLKSPDPDIFLPWELLSFKSRTNRCIGRCIPLGSIRPQLQGAATGASGERETSAAFAMAGRLQDRNFI
jgi:hypothetical protein